MSDDTKTLRTLITANHILHHHDVLDAFGHISVRHPHDASRFIMSADMPPALVSRPDDLVEYHVADGTSVRPDAPRGYIERYIHSELYKRYPAITSVVHSHARAVLPYVVTGDVRLQPVINTAGFLRREVKLWDIVPAYAEHATQNFLVKTAETGRELAEEFSSPASDPASTGPDETVVLMKRHGFTTCGLSIEKAVYRAIYTTVNAAVQTQTTLLVPRAAGGAATDDRLALSARQARDCEEMNEMAQERCWRLWVHEVQTNPLYRNGLD